MSFDGQLRTPVTLVNEYGSSLEAKALIAKRVSLSTQIQLSERMTSELKAVG